MSASLDILLKELRLTTILANWQEVAIQSERENWSFGQSLQYLCEQELTERKRRQQKQRLKTSGLPMSKTLDTLDHQRLNKKLRQQLTRLMDSNFIDQAQNVLAFGLPGRGKTHLLCGIGHHLIQKGYRVLFLPAYKLVQRLLVAKVELRLEKELKKLDLFQAIIIDDIGYVQQSREEMEILFTFLSERYERRSVLISSNLVFSQWDKIFKDSMTTAAAIDRLVHHCTILEMVGDSYRTEKALPNKRNDKQNEEINTMNT
jgi:DNA replication protein DnaC